MTDEHRTLSGEERLAIAQSIVKVVAELEPPDALTILTLALAICMRFAASDDETYEKLVNKMGALLMDAPSVESILKNGQQTH